MISFLDGGYLKSAEDVYQRFQARILRDLERLCRAGGRAIRWSGLGLNIKEDAAGRFDVMERG